MLSMLLLVQARMVQSHFSCVVEMVLQGVWICRCSITRRVGNGVFRLVGVGRSDRTVDLGSCCSPNELQAVLVTGGDRDCKRPLPWCPVVTQNKTQLCMRIRELCVQWESNLERAVGILNGLHWGVDIHHTRRSLITYIGLL